MNKALCSFTINRDFSVACLKCHHNPRLIQKLKCFSAILLKTIYFFTMDYIMSGCLVAHYLKRILSLVKYPTIVFFLHFSQCLCHPSYRWEIMIVYIFWLWWKWWNVDLRMNSIYTMVQNSCRRKINSHVEMYICLKVKFCAYQEIRKHGKAIIWSTSGLKMNKMQPQMSKTHAKWACCHLFHRHWTKMQISFFFFFFLE